MIKIFFAPPGVGKTTLAARFAFWEYFKKRFGKNHYKAVFANFPCKYTYYYEKSDIGTFDLSVDDDEGNTLVLLDEAGVEFAARMYKSMELHQIEHFKKHRKYHEDFYIFSQSFDCDKIIRDLTPELYYLKRCWFWPNTIKALRIHKSMIVDDTSHQLLDGYEFDNWFFRLFTTKRYYLPLYWGMFDSWDAPDLPRREYKYHG